MHKISSIIVSLPTLLWLTGAYIIGIAAVVGQATTIPWYCILLLLAWVYHHYYLVSLPRALLSVWGLAFLGSIRSQSVEIDRISKEAALGTTIRCIQGSVIACSRQHEPYRESIDFSIDSIRSQKTISSTPRNTIIHIQSRIPTGIKQGDRLIIHNLFIRPCSPRFLHNARKKGYCGQAFLNASTTCTTIDAPRPWHCSHKERLDAALTAQLNPETKSLFQTMFLGNRTISNSIQSLFNRWGISHMLARSGLHLVIIIAIIFCLLCLVPVHSRYKHIISLILLIGYTALSWPSISYLRALYTNILLLSCNIFSYKTHPLNLIACICLGTLIYQPYYLYALDFQLSFALAFTLAMLSHGNHIISCQSQLPMNR